MKKSTKNSRGHSIGKDLHIHCCYNIARHDVGVSEAEDAILDPNDLMLETRFDEEERVKAVGQSKRGRILVVVFTFRGEAIRPITAYDATSRDQELYLKGRHP